jgi:TonB family protein
MADFYSAAGGTRGGQRLHLSMKTWLRLYLIMILLPVRVLTFPSSEDEKGPTSFAYVGPQYVMTAELASPRSFVLNFINLSDFVIVVQPNEFIYRGASGRFYIGQVFDQEHKDNRGETFKYSASFLLSGHSATGLTVLGAFRETDRIEEMSIRIGAKRFYFQPMEKSDFEQLAAKIETIELRSTSGRAALQESNITEVGTVKTTDGTSEWDRDWQNLILPEGINPPKIIERPEVQPTEEAKKSRTYGKVRLSATINKNGGIQDLKVEKGLGRGLDERAMEAVKNSWAFLPATRNGEVLESTVRIEVDFPPPDAKKP